MDLVEPIMGVRHWDPTVVIEPETVAVRFEAGWPVALNGADVRVGRRPRASTANAIGGRHGLGMSDQIENRIIEAKSRGIYEAPGMALLHIAYERLVTAIHNEATHRELPHDGPPPRPPALRGPLVRPAVADAARADPALGRLGRHRRGHACGCAGATTTPSSTPPAPISPTSPSGCRWSGSRTPPSGPLDRIGQLHLRNLDIDDSRHKLDVYRRAGSLDPGGADVGVLGPAPDEP